MRSLILSSSIAIITSASVAFAQAPAGAAPAPTDPAAAPQPAPAPVDPSAAAPAPAATPAPAPAPAQQGYAAQVGAAAAPAAENPGVHEHDGFYFRFGLGVGVLALKLEDEDGDEGDMSGVGPSVELAFGGAVAPGVIIGGGIYGTSVASPTYKQGDAEEDGGTAIASMIGPFVDFYPNPTGGLHLQLAIGYTALSAEKGDVYPNDDQSGGGFGVVVGVGYEWWIGEQWSAGILGRVQYVSGSVEDSGDGKNKTDVSGPIYPLMGTLTFN
jgi:hypothetical protein